jgi:hypothetical protein
VYAEQFEVRVADVARFVWVSGSVTNVTAGRFNFQVARLEEPLPERKIQVSA